MDTLIRESLLDQRCCPCSSHSACSVSNSHFSELHLFPCTQPHRFGFKMAPIKYTPLETQPLENGNNLSELLKTRRTKQSTFSRKIAFAGFAVATLLFLGWRSDHLKYPSIESTKQHQTPCSYSAPKKNIWADLDEQEYQDVLSYLYTVPNNLNLTAVKKAGP